MAQNAPNSGLGAKWERGVLVRVWSMLPRKVLSHPNLEKAFEWSGVSRDGLSRVARDVLVLLLSSRDYTASIDSVRAHLGEPGPITHHEQMLLQRQLVTVTGRGRKLTDLGVTRAVEEARRLSQSA